jgi:hypothetical protein
MAISNYSTCSPIFTFTTIIDPCLFFNPSALNTGASFANCCVSILFHSMKQWSMLDPLHLLSRRAMVLFFPIHPRICNCSLMINLPFPSISLTYLFICIWVISLITSQLFMSLILWTHWWVAHSGSWWVSPDSEQSDRDHWFFIYSSTGWESSLFKALYDIIRNHLLLKHARSIIFVILQYRKLLRNIWKPCWAHRKLFMKTSI